MVGGTDTSDRLFPTRTGISGVVVDSVIRRKPCPQCRLTFPEDALLLQGDVSLAEPVVGLELSSRVFGIEQDILAT